MADSVEELFGYNRGNFMFDQKLRQWREYQEQNMRVKQFMLYREDMRDLNELTISKMDSYLMIAVLELGCCLDLLVHGVLHLHEMSKDEQPTWNLWLYVISLAEAFVFLFLSAWLAIHASVSAHSFTVRLLTQFVRLPVPSTEQLNAASATGTDYENMGIEDILRIPVIRQQAERLNAEQNAENEAEADPSGVAVSGLVMLQPGANEATAQKHVRVFRDLQNNWQAHDAYARACLALGSVEFKAVGQVVYRYESATSSETKDMVAKAVGTADEVPGPGQYQLPEPRPLAQPPALKGRTLPYSMPHPYAYNCAPDHTRSFLAPVRQSNNGEQIFGNGWKQGAAAAARRQGERNKHSAGKDDQVQLSELPAGVGTAPSVVIVEILSGGFSLLKKSRSAGAIRVPEIDSTVLEGVGRFYPPLAQKHQRANSQFLPMSSRRTESVRTREASEENQRLGQSKWKLAKVLEGIETATNAALEPLDVEKLKETAMKGLRDKAINRMKLQGVSKDQQEVILEEMDALLRERANSAKAEASDEIDPNEFSYPNVQGSENELFRVQEEAEESAEVEEYHLQDSMEADLDPPDSAPEADQSAPDAQDMDSQE